MTFNSNPLSEKPAEEETNKTTQDTAPATKEPTSAGQIWNRLLRLGLGETTLRTGTVIATGLLVLLVVWVMGTYFLKGQKVASATPTETTTAVPLNVPLINNPLAISSSDFTISRLADFHTNQPQKPREDVIEYQVVEGDTVFGIAEKFGLLPEYILWSNKHILGDNPAFIRPGLTLLIPPFDGAIHKWVGGIDGLNGVAKGFQVTPDVIIDWPGNHLSRATIGDYAMPNIADGTLIFIPHGIGQYTDWLPVFSRDNPAVASIMGPGSCGTVVDGPYGTGSFMWPTTETYLSGYDYSPSTNHFGIDIAGKLGNPIYAVDDGVVVYSGWNNFGYGNLLVIDHGHGWQSVYAHLNQILKPCGAYVFKGDVVAELGTTGNSSGPHLHFELRNGTQKLDPWSYLSK